VSARVTTEERPLAGRTVPVVVLSDDATPALAQVWPTEGFNVLRWLVGATELLDSAPDWSENPVPTRGGIPILFPFPNRIRDGRFRWAGRDYQLPPNDPAKKNAIHGFACRHPWRLLGTGTDEGRAWVRGEFQSSVDAPESFSLWPADCRLRTTVRLGGSALSLEFEVSDPDTVPLPFGLGIHPYFKLPTDPAAEAWIEAPARSVRELVESLPTGRKLPPPPDKDLNRPRSVRELTLDDLYTDLPADAPAESGLLLRGVCGHGEGRGVLELWAEPDFRDLVAFTPAHRRSVAIEPYTCATDAVNLQARGIDAGWRELRPGGAWTGRVELRWRA
jgi:aldose 1-epimerase